MVDSGGQIQRFARDERLARHAGFWWGFAEGVFFFIVPDVYISFATLFALRAGAVAWAFSIAGSAVAVVVIYLLAVVAGLDYVGFLSMIPGISDALVTRVTAQVEANGLPYTPLLVFGGVPLKLYAAASFSLGLSLGSVLLWTAFARIARIAPTFVVVAGIRLLLGQRIDARTMVWTAVLGAFWTAFYIFYFVAMS